MVFILIAGCEIVIAGLAVIIAGLAITISCHEPNFTVVPGHIANKRYLGRSHGRWNGDGGEGGGNREGGDSANNCGGGVQLFVNKHIT